MITTLDTNVLYDILQPGAEFAEVSMTVIEASLEAGSLAICELVYAELCCQFPSKNSCDAFLELSEITVSFPNLDACFLASRSWQKYRQQGGPRTRILPDFFIGAHAFALSSQLISRDAAFYRKYFPQLKVIDPTKA